MHRLKNAHTGDRAVVILGGPSMVANEFDLARLRQRDFVVFLESKALTPRLLASGLVPDYFLMLFPEKCTSNGFHNFAYRAFLAGYTFDHLVRPAFKPVLRELRDHFDDYFEPWRPHKGAHKRYRWRPDVQLKDSPYEFLAQLPSTRVLANGTLMDRYFPHFAYPNQVYRFEQPGEAQPFDRDAYYDVREVNGVVTVGNFGFYNSAAIALYPLLRYMGFRQVYFLGMDMSMLGTMEYAAPFTFRSMLHYHWYFWNTRHTFNAAYQQNRPWYIRPQSEFADLQALLDPDRIDLVRVYDPYKYTVPTPFMHSVSATEFWSV